MYGDSLLSLAALGNVCEMAAAVDAIKVADAVLKKYRRFIGLLSMVPSAFNQARA
jgi:5,10-methenyltetrahydromethanopterin hydrogenase